MKYLATHAKMGGIMLAKTCGIVSPKDRLIEPTMPLTLKYRGGLPATNDQNKRVREKQAIRRQLHPQIASFMDDPPQQVFLLSDVKERVTVGKFIYQPIICKRNKLKCKIDLVISSRDPFGSVIQNADIDNRLKTLFDALRSPHSIDELPQDDMPKQDEDLFWVLLQDDSLITDLSVKSETLYTPLKTNESKTDIELDIVVSVVFGSLVF